MNVSHRPFDGTLLARRASGDHPESAVLVVPAFLLPRKRITAAGERAGEHSTNTISDQEGAAGFFMRQ